MLGKKKAPVLTPEKQEERLLLEELRSVQRQLEATETLFNLTCDGDMIDYYIYQVNALDARYRSLYKKVKEHRLAAAQAAEKERELEPLG